MIHIVELYRTDAEHLSFNVSMVRAVKSIYPASVVMFYGEPELVRNTRTELAGLEGIEFCSIDIAHRRANKWARIPTDISLFLWLRRRVAVDDKCLFLSVSPALFLGMAVFQFTAKALCVIHANLAISIGQPRYNFIDRWFRERALIKNVPSISRCCVLERGVRDAAIARMPELSGCLNVIPHPVPEDVPLFRSRELGSGVSLNIGLCGLLTPQKGLAQMIMLAELFETRAVNFHLHGRLHQQLQNNDAGTYKAFATKPCVERIKRQEFVERMASLDLGAFFFTGSYYELTASGVLLDYMALGLPLFGYKNATIKAIEDEFGAIGWFCEVGGEAALLERLLDGEWRAGYQVRHDNLLEAAKQRSVENTGLTIKKLFDDLK